MQPNKYLLFQVDTASPKALKMKLLRIYKGLGSIKDTAQRTSLKLDTCKQIHKDYLKRNSSFSLGKAKHLAIDEFSIKERP